MRGNPGKMRTRITPNADPFYAVYVSILNIEKSWKNLLVQVRQTYRKQQHQRYTVTLLIVQTSV